MQSLKAILGRAGGWVSGGGHFIGRTEYAIEDPSGFTRVREVGWKKGGIRELEQLLRESDATNYKLERELQNIKRESNDSVRELEKRLNDSDTANSDLEGKLQDLEHEMSTLSNEYQDVLGRLRRAEIMAKKYRGRYKETSERCDELHTQCKDLGMKNEEITTTKKKQEREIKTLRDNNARIADELEIRIEQLNKITGDIARQNQQVNTSAIRDDEYLARELASLAKHIRNWSFTHLFRQSETFVPTVGIRDLRGAIGRIASGSNLPEIFKDRAASRRVVSGLLADWLRENIFEPLLLGSLPEPFHYFEKMIEKTGIQKSPWLSQTISLFVQSEEFKRMLNERVCILSGELGEMLGELLAHESDESKVFKRNQKLQAIVERAVNLAVEFSQQPSWFHFSTICPGEQFSRNIMEDVGTDMSLEEDDSGACDDDCRVSLSVFPCVYRCELVESEKRRENVMIHRAWVTVETRDSDTCVEQTDKNNIITNEEANGSMEPGLECPSGHCGRVEVQGGNPEAQGGEMGAPGEESGNSLHPSMQATQNAISTESTSPESTRGMSHEADLAADVDLGHEKMEGASLN
ncbi:hypothetical protein HOY82DRAFT_628348 [Tuber indicum]|nr:hypothetical protein HOY82DRAFT_628348 [Tuber indicum]